MTRQTRSLTQAQYEVEQAKKRLASTLGSLQYRLRPGNLVNEAWEGVRDKSSEMADGALQKVKDRPMTASGIIAAILIFLARDPLWAALSKLLGRDEEEDPGEVTTRVIPEEKNYDLTAPAANRLVDEGVTS